MSLEELEQIASDGRYFSKREFLFESLSALPADDAASLAFKIIEAEIRYGAEALESSDKRIEEVMKTKGVQSEIIRVTDICEPIVPESIKFHKRGTTSAIFKCSSQSSTTPLALKIVVNPFCQSDEIQRTTEYYKQMIKPLLQTVGDARLYKPVAVPIASARRYVLMDFVEGKTLGEAIDEMLQSSPEATHDYEHFLRLEPESRLRLCRRVLGDLLLLLEACARAEVLHGDLSPANIILRPIDVHPSGDFDNLRSTVVDFGVNYAAALRLGTSEELLRVSKYMAPELRAASSDYSYQSNPRADLFAMGVLLLDMICPPRKSVSTSERIQRLYEFSPALGTLYDDLVAPQTVLRGSWTAGNPSGWQAGAVRELRDEALAVIDDVLANGSVDGNFAGPNESRLIRRIVGFQFSDQLKQLLLGFWNDRRARRRGPLRYRYVEETGVHLSRWATWCMLWFSLCLSAFLAYTAADVYDQSWFFGLPLPFRDRYADRTFWDNFAGRLVGVSFALVAAKYYLNIFGGITFRRWHNGRWQITEGSIRLNSFVYAGPILATIVVEPRWWPFCSAIGCGIVALNNYVVARTARGILKTRFEIPGSTPMTLENYLGEGVGDLEMFASNREYGAWGSLMFWYAFVLFLVGLLFSSGYLHDILFMAIVVGLLLNGLKLYANNCSSQAPKVRGPLARIMGAERRLLRVGNAV